MKEEASSNENNLGKTDVIADTMVMQPADLPKEEEQEELPGEIKLVKKVKEENKEEVK